MPDLRADETAPDNCEHEGEQEEPQYRRADRPLEQTGPSPLTSIGPEGTSSTETAFSY